MFTKDEHFGTYQQTLGTTRIFRYACQLCFLRNSCTPAW